MSSLLNVVHRNGADKFIVNRRSCAAANFATSSIASGHTVIGKPLNAPDNTITGKPRYTRSTETTAVDEMQFVRQCSQYQQR